MGLGRGRWADFKKLSAAKCFTLHYIFERAGLWGRGGHTVLVPCHCVGNSTRRRRVVARKDQAEQAAQWRAGMVP